MEVIHCARMPTLSRFSFMLSVLLILSTNRVHADAASDARAAFERGVAASRAERWEEARREFQASRALVVKPSTLFNLAVVDLKLGLFDEAIAALDAFETLADPREHADMRERAAGMRAQAERERDAARPAVERARGLISPSDLSTEARRSFERGQAAYAQGDDRSALEALREAHTLSGRDELLYDVGVVADRLREDELAVRSFERFVAAFPALPEAQLATRRLERLRQIEAEKLAPPQIEPTPLERVDGPADAPHAPPQATSLVVPRALVAVGATLIASAVGGALWWDNRAEAYDRCAARADECTNADVVTRQKRSAMATTLVLGATGLALLTASSTALAKAKRSRVEALALGFARERLAFAVRVRF